MLNVIFFLSQKIFFSLWYLLYLDRWRAVCLRIWARSLDPDCGDFHASWAPSGRKDGRSTPRPSLDIYNYLLTLHYLNQSLEPPTTVLNLEARVSHHTTNRPISPTHSNFICYIFLTKPSNRKRYCILQAYIKDKLPNFLDKAAKIKMERNKMIRLICVNKDPTNCWLRNPEG